MLTCFGFLIDHSLLRLLVDAAHYTHGLSRQEVSEELGVRIARSIARRPAASLANGGVIGNQRFGEQIDDLARKSAQRWHNRIEARGKIERGAGRGENW